MLSEIFKKIYYNYLKLKIFIIFDVFYKRKIFFLMCIFRLIHTYILSRDVPLAKRFVINI